LLHEALSQSVTVSTLGRYSDGDFLLCGSPSTHNLHFDLGDDCPRQAASCLGDALQLARGDSFLAKLNLLTQVDECSCLVMTMNFRFPH
jgi:hypothetical protein